MLINLHSHLEGRVRPSTARELAVAAGIPQPPGGWDAAIRLDGPGTLTDYLAKVQSTYPMFSSPEHIARIAREAVEDAAATGLDYLELRFGPATHADAEMSVDQVIGAVVEGMAEGSRTTGMPTGAVVAILRHHDDETNVSVARAAARFAGDVVGFDLAGDELRFPELEPHADAFAIARAAGLGLTCHAAEAGPPASARRAAQLLGATRIGHGAHIIDDADELRWAAESGIVIEVCPTSNWYTGAVAHLADHPARVFRDAGVRLALGDDNPMQTGSDLRDERAILVNQLGWSEADLLVLDQTSLDAAFLDESVRSVLSVRVAA